MPLAILRRRPRSRAARLAASLLVTAAVALAGCDRGPAADGSAVPEAARQRGNVFAYIDRGDIITLDLNQMSYMQDFRVMYAIREGLYGYDPVTSKPVAALAVKTDVSADKKTWTFTLREGATWTNGDPIVANDFVFSWRLMLEAPGSYSSLFYYIKNAEKYERAYRDQTGMSFDDVGVKAPDDRTIVVTLDHPVPYLEDLLAFPPFYPRHAKSMEPFKGKDPSGRVTYDAKYTLPQNVVTNGPFRFADWQGGQRLAFKKSETYWDAAGVKLDGIDVTINSDPQSAFVSYDQGEVDWLTDVNPDIALPLKQQGRADLRLSQDYGTAFLTANCAEKVEELKDAKNPLADVRVRRALAMTIDKQQIVETITKLGERPADRYIPPGYFENFVSKPSPARDVEAAKKLLAEAGYPDGKGMPPISISYNTDNPVRRDIAQVLAHDWNRQLGITVSPNGKELKGYRSYVQDRQYTLALVAWYGDYMDPSTWTDKYRSTSLNNDTKWTPPAYDELLDKAASEPDEAKRATLLAEAESMLNEQAPIIPLYYYVSRQMYRDNVKGITPNPRNTISWKAISVTR